MKKQNQNQQGDVILTRINKVPVNCVKAKQDPRGLVLAEGEVTGHYHGITESGVELLEEPETQKRFLVNNNDHPVKLKHQEHNVVEIPPGAWEVRQVREVDHLTGMVGTVAD